MTAEEMRETETLLEEVFSLALAHGARPETKGAMCWALRTISKAILAEDAKDFGKSLSLSYVLANRDLLPKECKELMSKGKK